MDINNSANLREIENAVIGTLINDNKGLDDAIVKISADDFSSRQNNILFAAIVSLYANGKQIDANTLVNNLKENGNLAKVGGEHYISNIISYWISDSTLTDYLGIIIERSQKRKILYALEEGIKIVNKPSVSSEDSFSQIQQKILSATISKSKVDFEPAFIIGKQVREDLINQQNNPDKLTGVTSGYRFLDSTTNGFQKGELSILAARPSMGKTTLAVNMAQRAAFQNRNKGAVLFFSIEMPKKQILKKIISAETLIYGSKINSPRFLKEEDWKKINTSIDRLSSYNILIDDTADLSLANIQAKVHREAKILEQNNQEILLVIIDYLQMLVHQKPGENRQQEVASISRGLKILARDLNIPIMTLSQLSRSPEKREDKRPLMSDLRESGAIEQDADLIMFLYRDDYYNREENDEEEKSSSIAKAVATDLIIAKNRNGATKTVSLKFIKEYGLFEDYIKNKG